MGKEFKKFVVSEKYGKVAVMLESDKKTQRWFAGDMYGKVVAEATTEDKLMKKL